MRLFVAIFSCVVIVEQISRQPVVCFEDELNKVAEETNQTKTISIELEQNQAPTTIININTNNVTTHNSTWFERIKDKARGLFITDEMDTYHMHPPNVRQDIYNYYNINQPRRPYNQRPLGQPPPPPAYYDYDDANYPPPAYYPPPRPNYPPPYYQRPDYGSPYYQPQPPPPPPPTTTTTTTTTPAPANVITPIGYMLVDNYRGPYGSYSRPLAFFKS